MGLGNPLLPFLVSEVETWTFKGKLKESFHKKSGMDQNLLLDKKIFSMQPNNWKLHGSVAIFQ